MNNKNEPETFPLTSSQRDIWLDQVVHPDIPLYNIGGYLRIDGEIDRDVFKQAVVQVVNKNDSLRIVFHENDSKPVQEFCLEVPFNFPFIDFSGEENSFEKAVDWMLHEFRKPFPLYDSLLFRYALVKVSEKCYCYFNCQHHLIIDGWGVSLIGRYIAEEYNILISGTGNILHKPSYKEFITNDLEYLKSSKYERSKRYWEEKYFELPAPIISGHYAHQYERGKSPSSISNLTIERELFNGLEAFAKPLKATAFHVILAVLYTYFLKTSEEKDFIVGMPILNRSTSAFKETMGTFTSVSPHRFSFGLNISTVELIKLIANILKKDYRHQRFPLGEINKLCKSHNTKFHQLFDMSISFEKHSYEFYINGSPVEAITLQNGFEQTPLALAIKEYNEAMPITIAFNYNLAAFQEAEIELLKKRFKFLLREMVNQPDLPVSNFSLIPPEEKEILLLEWNKTEVEHPANTCIHHLFEKQAEMHPEAIAIVSGNSQTTYKELNNLVNCVVETLQSCRISPEEIIGLCTDGSVEMIAGILGIMKAGGVYLPIDPSYPRERIDFMINDSDIKIILVPKKSNFDFLGNKPEMIYLDDTVFNLYRNNSINGESPGQQENIAYVIYTSGSTGKPKGVLITHKSLCNLANAQIRIFGIHPGDVVLQFASPSFDASVSEIFTTLCSGATLCLSSKENIIPGPALQKTLMDYSITHVTLPPSSLAVLPNDPLPCLKTLIVAGEACPQELAENWSKGRRFINAYGPTESTVCTTTFEYTSKNRNLPIGKPIDNIQVYILDREHNLLPIGVPGELFIGGAGLAKEYLNRQELTNERFIPDPYQDISARRLYKTGDSARYLTDGNIEFLGRKDHQVKVRGYRIELGEIEKVLSVHPSVRESIAVVREDQPGMKQLVVYITQKQDEQGPTSKPEIFSYIRKKLPGYMVPQDILFLEDIPLTPNGKVDRNALSKPGYGLNSNTRNQPSTSETEKLLLQLWETVCGEKKIGIQDDFFEYGLDSLQAVQLLGIIQKTFDINIPQADLFQRSTIKELSDFLDDKKKTIQINEAQSPSTTISTSVDSSPLMVPLSVREGAVSFYCMASGQGDRARFTRIAEELKEDCSLYMLHPIQPETHEDMNFDLNTLADNYANIIISRETGECRIGGFSIGGIVTLEVASILKKKGIEIGNPILIDTLAPTKPGPAVKLMRLFKKIIDLPVLKRLGIGKFTLNGRPLDVLFSDPGLLMQIDSLQAYKVKDFHGTANLIMSQTLRYFRYILFRRWHNHVKGTLNLYYVPGFHGNIFSEKNIKYLADAVRQCLK